LVIVEKHHGRLDFQTLVGQGRPSPSGLALAGRPATVKLTALAVPR